MMSGFLSPSPQRTTYRETRNLAAYGGAGAAIASQLVSRYPPGPVQAALERAVPDKSLIPPLPPEPYGDDFRCMVRTLKALVEYMESTGNYRPAEVKQLRDALELINHVRPDLSPARNV